MGFDATVLWFKKECNLKCVIQDLESCLLESFSVT